MRRADLAGVLADPGVDLDPLDQQAFTACFAIDFLPDEDHTIDRPASYDHWRVLEPPAWSGPLLSFVNGTPFGRPDAGRDMTFDFPTLIAHAARTRPLCAGTIIGSGTVSNRDGDGSPGRPIAEGGAGYSCIAELRMIETIANGEPATAASVVSAPLPLI